MNPIIVSSIIASAAFIVSIFAANWLNQQHINKLMEQVDKRIVEQGLRFDVKFEGLRELLNERLKAFEERVNLRFEALEERFNLRFDALEERFNARFDRIEQRLETLDQRVKRLEDTSFKPTLP